MRQAVTISIVEDDFLISRYIETALCDMGYLIPAICNSYESFIESLSENTPDLVLIDIRIQGDKNGIDIAQYLHDHVEVPFIFISSLHDKKTIDAAKKTLPAAYLIKPFAEDDLYAAIEIALLNFASRKQTVIHGTEEGIILKDAFFIKQKQAYVKVEKKHVIYFEARDNYVRIITATDQYLLRQTMQSLADQLPDYFFRIHRSFIVNLKHIREVLPDEVILDAAIRLPVSRSLHSSLLERIGIG